MLFLSATNNRFKLKFFLFSPFLWLHVTTDQSTYVFSARLKHIMNIGNDTGLQAVAYGKTILKQSEVLGTEFE